jgi:hypothetical protein
MPEATPVPTTRLGWIIFIGMVVCGALLAYGIIDLLMEITP